MSELSSLSNGGLSGVSSSGLGETPRCIFITDEVPPATPIEGLSLGPSIITTAEYGLVVHDATPTQEGELIMYCPSPYQFAIPYCSVLTDTGYGWVPTLIYRRLVQSVSR
jgi:hypothetical protein